MAISLAEPLRFGVTLRFESSELDLGPEEWRDALAAGWSRGSHAAAPRGALDRAVEACADARRSTAQPLHDKAVRIL